MKFIADFHLHSKYSRATSPRMDLENLDKWARIKGIKVLGTGDFTHTEWLKELKEKLEPAETGLFRLKTKPRRSRFATLRGRDLRFKNNETRFVLTSEISCIYSKGGRVRKIHLIIFAPSFEVAEKINVQLGWIGNLAADGRPILGTDSQEILKIVLGAGEDTLLVPAHAYTPWFSIFGSRSGFDSIEECFGDLTKHIYAIETGLSSDPPLSWRNSKLDDITFISCSDSHSPAKIGREASVFEGEELDYHTIIQAIKNRGQTPANLRLAYTIEFFPEEGKYHYDGHRDCGIVLSPQETKKYNGICPRCGRPLTVGVLNRAEELADRPEGFKPEGAPSFKSLVPLEEIVAEAIGQTVGTKQVKIEYEKLIKKLGPELKILLEVSRQELETATLPEIAEGIIRVREGKVIKEPGYDGVYGKIRIFSEKEATALAKQKTLF